MLCGITREQLDSSAANASLWLVAQVRSASVSWEVTLAKSRKEGYGEVWGRYSFSIYNIDCCLTNKTSHQRGTFTLTYLSWCHFSCAPLVETKNQSDITLTSHLFLLDGIGSIKFYIFITRTFNDLNYVVCIHFITLYFNVKQVNESWTPLSLKSCE